MGWKGVEDNKAVHYECEFVPENNPNLQFLMSVLSSRLNISTTNVVVWLLRNETEFDGYSAIISHTRFLA